MASKEKYSPKMQADLEATPFESAEEAWFWFIQAQEARNDGARFIASQGLVTRPCEPLDFLRLLDRLYRQRRLLRDHLLVLRHYGRCLLPPDPMRIKEVRAHGIWTEALNRMGPVLERKGIVRKSDILYYPCRSGLFETMGVAAE